MIGGVDQIEFMIDELLLKHPALKFNAYDVKQCYYNYKKILKMLVDRNILFRSHSIFAKQFHRKTGYKGLWCMNDEINRLMFGFVSLYSKCKPYLRLYQRYYMQDAIESKLEGILKDLKGRLQGRESLNDELVLCAHCSLCTLS